MNDMWHVHKMMLLTFDFLHSDGVLDRGYAMIPVRSSFIRPLEKTALIQCTLSLEMTPS